MESLKCLLGNTDPEPLTSLFSVFSAASLKAMKVDDVSGWGVPFLNPQDQFSTKLADSGGSFLRVNADKFFAK